MENLNSETNRWAFFEKLLFRFIFVFFILLILAYPNGALPVIRSFYRNYVTQLQTLVLWLGKLLLNGKVITQPAATGSGDTAFNYVLLLAVSIISVFATMVWSVLDRHCASYQKLLYFLTLLVRAYVGFMMINYGLLKIFNGQFVDISENRLKSTYGQSSPMGLAWTFFSYSTGYKYFMGFAEMIGGLLLLFRRTTALGAVVVLTVTTNIMAVNYFFDVPVKIVSTILVTMSLFLILKDAKRFLNFFLLNKTTKPVNLGSFNGKPHHILITGLKYALIIYIVYPVYHNNVSQKDRFKIYGVYDVKEFNLKTTNNTTDSLRWKRFSIGFDSAKVWLSDNKPIYFLCNVDYDSKNLVLFNAGSHTLIYIFSYQQLENNVLTLSSIDLPKKSFSYIKSQKSNGSAYPLMSRGFHWISEHPYNR